MARRRRRHGLPRVPRRYQSMLGGRWFGRKGGKIGRRVRRLKRRLGL